MKMRKKLLFSFIHNFQFRIKNVYFPFPIFNTNNTPSARQRKIQNYTVLPVSTQQGG